MRIAILFFLSLLINNTSSAQNIFNEKESSSKNGYNIDVNLKNIDNTIDTLMLGVYSTGLKSTLTYVKDTAIIKQERITFKGNKSLEEGVYFIYEPNSKQLILQFLITENQHFNFSLDYTDPFNTIIFEENKENTIYFNYNKYMSSEHNNRLKLQKNLENTDDNQQRSKIENEIKKISNGMKKYHFDFLEKNSNMFCAKFIKAQGQIEIPENIGTNLSKEEQDIAKWYYQQEHYWDNIDFSESRLLRTNFFYQKMEDYFEKITFRNPDSIIKAADVLINKSKVNNEFFQFTVMFITAKYERPKIMGLDAIFVHMIENYFLTNECCEDWTNEDQRNKMIQRAREISPNLIGKKAPEFTDIYGRPFMTDPSGATHSLAGVKAKYTALIFFGPTCGHCKKQMPKIKNVLDSLTEKGIDIATFVVATEFDKKEWEKFIKNQETEEWLNVADIRHKEAFYAYKLKDEDKFISADLKKSHNVKKIEIPENVVAEDLVNISELKRIKPKYESTEFLLNTKQEFLCIKELEPVASSDWRDKYDIKSTPVIYLLDVEKRILAKKIDYTQIANVIANEERK